MNVALIKMQLAVLKTFFVGAWRMQNVVDKEDVRLPTDKYANLAQCISKAAYKAQEKIVRKILINYGK